LGALSISQTSWEFLRFERKLVAPPEKLLLALQNSPRSEDFQEVPSGLKEGKS
jgi:hypothetical protein